MCFISIPVLFFFNDTATTEIYTYLHTLSLPDALPIFTHFDFDISRQRGVRDFPESVQGQRVVLAKLCSQSRGEGSKAVSHPVPAIKFNAMPLSVVETDRLHMLELLERPRETGRGVLPAGK